MARWLADKPRDAAVALAARAALRVAPLLVNALGPRGGGASRVGKEVVLPVFRAAAVPWVACKYPTHRPEISASAADAASAAADADLVDRGASAAALAGRPLWITEFPSWARENWGRLEQALLKENQDWKVWTDWYRARLEGRPSDEGLEVARVMIAEDIWKRGPRAVNAEIARLIEKYQPPKPLADIPSAFGFGWTDAGTIRIVSSPANWPVFPLPTSERDHRDRLEACRILAQDMISALKARRYQTRGEFLEGLEKYAFRLPQAPGDGNILLADAEARTLRNLFAAEGQILSPGFAARLKTFLEQHIGLRPFYPEVGKFYRDVQSGRIEMPPPQDAVEGFIKGVQDHTPSVFDPSVTGAVEVCAQPAPEIAPPGQRPPADPSQPEPPADPLKELDPKKAHDFTFGGVVNALWKVYLEGDKVPKAAEGWKKAGDALQPFVEPILKWLRSFMPFR